MTTTVKTVTSTKQTLTRDWADLDPKVRNQIPVVALVLVASIVGVALGRLSLVAAGALDIPFLLNFAIAYITTSSHRQLILDGIKAGVDTLKEATPVIEAAVPEAAPVIEDAESLAAAVQGGVIASTTAIPTTPAA